MPLRGGFITIQPHRTQQPQSSGVRSGAQLEGKTPRSTRPSKIRFSRLICKRKLSIAHSESLIGVLHGVDGLWSCDSSCLVLYIFVTNIYIGSFEYDHHTLVKPALARSYYIIRSIASQIAGALPLRAQLTDYPLIFPIFCDNKATGMAISLALSRPLH